MERAQKYHFQAVSFLWALMNGYPLDNKIVFVKKEKA